MNEEIPEWLEGKHLSNAAVRGLREIRLPSRTMADVSIQSLPAALVTLRAIADAIYNMSFHDEPTLNLRTALRVIRGIQCDLDDAKTAVEVALLAIPRSPPHNTATGG